MYEVSRAVTEAYKVWLAGALVVLALAWPWLTQYRPSLPAYFRGRMPGQMLLAVVLLLSALNYTRWSSRSLVEQLDCYDLFHYYLNAKYFDELGYYDLYPALLLADADNKPYYDNGPQYMAQSEVGHSFEPIEHGVARGKVVREQRFTPERWKQFEHDMLYLQRDRRDKLGAKVWREMIQDHGFNGTPAWTLIAEPFARAVPVESVKLLCYIDVVLLAAAIAVVAWAYDGWVASWIAAFIVLSYSGRWPYIPWVFLRYDWISCLIAAVALLGRGQKEPEDSRRQYALYGAGGALVGLAAVLRLFPAMWMWGPLFVGLAGLAGRRVHKRLLVLAGGFLLGAAVVEGAALVRFGPETVVVHMENMVDHNKPEQLSSRRVGLAIALVYDGQLEPKFIKPETKQRVADQKNLRYGLAALTLVLFGAALRRARDDEALAYGFLPFFLLTTASYYYYIARITLVLLHASDLSKWRNRIGLAMLFAIEVFSNWAETEHEGYRVYLIGHLAWGLVAYTVVMGAFMAWEAFGPSTRPPPTTPPPPAAEPAPPAEPTPALP